MSYQNENPIVNKFLNPDGSITTLQNEVASLPNSERAAQYKQEPYTANKVLNPDGSISTFPAGEPGENDPRISNQAIVNWNAAAISQANIVVEKDFETLDDMIAWTSNSDNMLLVREGTIFRVLADNSPDFKAVKNLQNAAFEAKPLEPIHAEKILTGNITQGEHNQLLAQSIVITTAQTLNQSKAYTDSLVKSYETINLYFGQNGDMTTNKPTGIGTILSAILGSIETLMFNQSYRISNDGIVLKDNLYILATFWESVSTSRDTYLRFVYTVGGSVIFDFQAGALNNQYSTYEYTRQILNQQNTDIPYTAGTIANLSIYGRVSNGSDEIRLRVGDIDLTSGLFRNAPIATLSDSKITTDARGTPETLSQLLQYILSKLP